ncbi:MAG TPA: leucine--tRNA ligase [Patescibacteria group bacterium]|nr:leucine--tRNA ligase [Patescibacteria group bacterium]
MRRYNPKEIEPKWQKKWDDDQTYKADLTSNKTKYIAMSMFNYPSGAGIHIGHAMNYTISDVLARFKRQQGYESYHPVGWDSFGLPAENYALKAGVSPQKSMATIIPSYHKQYKAMGWSNDWSKEIATHEPKYYKWTQWIFSEMYRAGLAYQDSRMQWWCSIDNTVLANEQVIDGKCWRHDGPDDPLVTQREVKQWFFKITDYADELLEAIDDLDWTESVKLAQKNWIGRSIGAEIRFKVHGQKQEITVFTTRADTIFSAAFMVLAPEHSLVDKLTTKEHQKVVKDYVADSLKKTDIERQADKEKTGVFTGAYAINPANNEKVPIWVGDFVIASYGTGAVFGDIHDERDFEFLKKFKIPARVTIIPENKKAAEAVKAQEYPYTSEGILIDSGEFTGMRSEEARDKITAWLAKKDAAVEKVNFKMRDWSVSRQRYWGAPIPIVYCPDHGAVLLPDAELPVILPEIKDYASTDNGRSALARAADWLHTTCPTCGKPAERETDTLDTYICSSWYMLRYFDPDNEKRIFNSDIVNKWIPIDFYNGADHATAHMIYARFVTRFLHKQGLVDKPEPFKKFLFNGKVTASDGRMFSKSKGNGIDPLEIINDGYGADALRTYLMFAAPLELWVRWDAQGVPATHRFLSRVWNLTQEFLASTNSHTDKKDQAADILPIIHRTIKKVSDDLETQKYNTAIAAMMQCTNDLYKLKTGGFSDENTWKFTLESLVMLIAPFGPHIAEELWHELGHEDSVHVDHWPTHDTKYLSTETITIVVQVNGKVRANIEVATGSSEDEVVKAAKSSDKAKTYLDKPIRKTIYVPGKLVNFVV